MIMKIRAIARGILSLYYSNCIASKALIIPAISQIPDLEGAAILIESLTKVSDIEGLNLDSQYLMGKEQV